MDSAPDIIPALIVRPLRAQQEFHECVELQKLTWGEDFGEAVPASLLKVCQRIGGITAGAFDARGRMLGFVFGITGVRDGCMVHWSDMLAVRPEARGMGVGRLLKEHQRETAREMGVEMIYWTFDPLVARNAHLNLNRLGARVQEYALDMYGDSDSPLHQGLGTDRLVVAWPTCDAAHGPEIRAVRDGGAGAPVVNVTATAGAPHPVEPGAIDAPLVRIEIPSDIHAVRDASPSLAQAWRSSTRQAFLASLENGYRVLGFVRDPGTRRCYYLLSDSSRTTENSDAVG